MKPELQEIDISKIVGETIFKIIEEGNEKLVFFCKSGKIFVMHHEQDCCEFVEICDINGDLNGILGSPITLAEKVTNTDDTGICHNTWTFYKIGNLNETVVIRWFGESNGYYSEEVDFCLVKTKKL